MSAPSSAAVRPNRFASAIIGVFFGLILAGMGGFFCWLLWQGVEKAASSDGWRETPCTILESRIAEELPVPNSPVSYTAVIRYRYEVEGKTFESDKIKRVAPKSAQRDRMEALIADFPVGAVARCFVSPDGAGDVLLLRDSKAPGYAMWFPALFVVGGLGIAISSVGRNFFGKARP